MSWRAILGRALCGAALAVTGLGALPAAAADAVPASMESIAKCVEANSPARTMSQRIELSTVDRVGEGRTYDIKGMWKREDSGLSKLVLRVSAPADLRGSAFLMIERADRSPDLFSYLPELDKVRRISARGAGGSLFGSDFTYEDVQRIQTMGSASHSELLGEEERAGRPTWKIESEPAPDDVSAYTRMLSWIDRERCVPVAAEFFAADAEPVKVLSVPPAEVAREGAGWFPMKLVLEDRPSEGRSTLRVVEIELDVKLGEKHFSESALGRRR